jgi:hypothetical protein
MRRQPIVLGLAVFALLVFAFISATLAAPDNTPLLQGSSSPSQLPRLITTSQSAL